MRFFVAKDQNKNVNHGFTKNIYDSLWTETDPNQFN